MWKPLAGRRGRSQWCDASARCGSKRYLCEECSAAWTASSAQRGVRRTREDCHHGEREAVSEGNVAENMTVPRKADRANRLDYKALRRRILARVDCGEPAGSPQAALRRRILARVGSGEPAGSLQADLRRGILAWLRRWGGDGADLFFAKPLAATGVMTAGGGRSKPLAAARLRHWGGDGGGAIVFSF